MSEYTLHCQSCGDEVDAPEDIPDLTAETDLEEFSEMIGALEVHCGPCYDRLHPSLTNQERQEP